MKKIPILLNIDDATPVLSVFYQHAGSKFTADGRPLLGRFPNSFLFEFCKVVERFGMKGKFSVVPMPGNEGDIAHGLQGVDDKEKNEWLETVKTRLMPSFTVGPEMLTHHKAVDLETGKDLPLNEMDWSNAQDRTTLTPYISRALSLLKEVGIKAFGVSSPWSFGLKVEKEYIAAISQAVYETTGLKKSWYFLHQLPEVSNARAWIASKEGDRVVVALPSTTHDHFWQTIDTTRSDEEYVSSVADELITADGKAGAIVECLQNGTYPNVLTHWQSLYSNGTMAGLRALNEVGRRVQEHLSDRVEWTSAEELVELVTKNPEAFQKPTFLDVQMSKKSIDDFYKQYGYPKSFKETLNGVFERLALHEIQGLLACYPSAENFQFEELGKRLQGLSEKYGIHRYTMNLFALVILTPKLREFYKEHNVENKIADDTIGDIQYKYNECKKVYGVEGVAAWEGWYKPIFSLRLFQIGRLQYEYETFLFDKYEKDGKVVVKGEEILSVHIPATGTPLDHDECLKSYAQAKAFFAKHFEGRQMTFICWSWLLNPDNEQFMDKNSNILRFKGDYDVIDQEIYEDYNVLSAWIFGRKEVGNLEPSAEDTSLQKRIKEYLKKGGKLGRGYGVFFA